MYEELVEKLREKEHTLGETFRLFYEAADAIEQLQKSICPHYIRNVHDRGDDSLCSKFKCEVAAVPKWIPVTERLPEDEPLGVRVLCCLTKKRRGWSWVDDRLFMDGKFWHPKGQKGKVTHWMPLPSTEGLNET